MRYLIPLVLFLIIMALLWKGLQKDPHQLPSVLINQPVAEFSYPSLLNKQPITKQQFLGHVTLLNVWATWCVTCHAEHAVMMDIANSKEVVIYGLNYKDNPLAAMEWLKKYGNPYQDVISDTNGTLAIDFGVYGTPESFVIDSKGIIRYKHIGAISPDVWKDKIEPEVKKWRAQS